jgi:hypothetical protein
MKPVREVHDRRAIDLMPASEQRRGDFDFEQRLVSIVYHCDVVLDHVPIAG